MKDNIVDIKAKAFALQIVKAYQFLTNIKKEFVLSKQLLRSGTAIGALVRERECEQSRADFLSKIYIALKEANETRYWLELLYESNIIDMPTFRPLNDNVTELIKLLAAITKTITLKKQTNF